MKSKGIRIEDEKNPFQCIELTEILNEINYDNIQYWSLMFMNAIGNLGEGKSIPKFQNQIIKSPNGVLLIWKELYDIAIKLEQIFDITIIGSNNLESIHRYDSEQEMYENCEIVIEMIDGGCWEVFSKEETLINRLASKFTKIKFLETDFLNKYD